MNGYTRIVILLFIIFPQILFSQVNKGALEINGYVKYLQLNSYDNNFDQLFTGQLLHHRLNTKYLFPKQNFIFNVSIRSRFFYGEIVKLSPGFGDLINEQSNDQFNLGFTYFNGASTVGHTVIDRLNFEYLSENFELRVGRQRINWGIHTIWNPNDIFNSFSFTDFDYEERPGSDALLMRYYYGDNSGLEFAIKAADEWSEFIGALKWNTQLGSYDLQGIAGYYKENIMAGMGWAGNAGTLGFKGELSWFGDLSEEEINGLVLTAGMDYSFANGLYQHLGFFYNKLGDDQFDAVLGIVSDVSPKNIYPYKWVIYDQFSYSFHPLWGVGSFVLYSPIKAHSLFIQTFINYNLAPNWDMSFYSQVFFEKQGSYRSPFQGYFIRLKWSY